MGNVGVPEDRRTSWKRLKLKERSEDLLPMPPLMPSVDCQAAPACIRQNRAVHVLIIRTICNFLKFTIVNFRPFFKEKIVYFRKKFVEKRRKILGILVLSV